MRTRGVEALVLWPPGPQRREVNGAAARAFARFGDPASLAMPDCLLLAAGSTRECRESGLREAWTGIEGGFSGHRVEERKGCLYLIVEGPLAALVERIGPCFESISPLPFEPALGFYLGKVPGPSDSAERQNEGPGTPASVVVEGILDKPFGWRSCRLALLDIEGDLEGLLSLNWHERASAWRPAPRRRGTNGDEATIPR